MMESDGIYIVLTPEQEAKCSLLGRVRLVKSTTGMGKEGCYVVRDAPDTGHHQALRHDKPQAILLMYFSAVDEALTVAAAPHKYGAIWR